LKAVTEVKEEAEGLPLLLLTSVAVNQSGLDASDDVLPLPVDEIGLRMHLQRFLG